MRKNYFLFFLLLLVFTNGIAQTNVQNLLVENRTNPMGLDITQPRFSWQLLSAQRNVYQTAYEIKLTAGKKTIWSTGKVNSDASVQVEYQGPAL